MFVMRELKSMILKRKRVNKLKTERKDKIDFKKYHVLLDGIRNKDISKSFTICGKKLTKILDKSYFSYYIIYVFREKEIH